MQLIEECPEELWGEKAGSWPIWQHVVHAASGVTLFCPGEKIAPPEGLKGEILGLREPGEGVCARKAALDYFKAARGVAEAYLGSLADVDLAGENGHLKAVGLEWSIAKSLVMLSSHTLYHLWNADAVLRSHGHKGIF